LATPLVAAPQATSIGGTTVTAATSAKRMVMPVTTANCWAERRVVRPVGQRCDPGREARRDDEQRCRRPARDNGGEAIEQVHHVGHLGYYFADVRCADRNGCRTSDRAIQE
jgi:hypothetical protein